MILIDTKTWDPGPGQWRSSAVASQPPSPASPSSRVWASHLAASRLPTLFTFSLPSCFPFLFADICALIFTSSFRSSGFYFPPAANAPCSPPQRIPEWRVPGAASDSRIQTRAARAAGEGLETPSRREAGKGCRGGRVWEGGCGFLTQEIPPGSGPGSPRWLAGQGQSPVHTCPLPPQWPVCG